jgi:HEAT repeat protein/S1-C subfamily serine protease/DNA-directed RNA polymerase subunit RPC12/RpoP
MPVRLTCPKCDASLSVEEDKRGKKIRCRKCEAVILVPAKAKPAAVEVVDDDDEEIVEVGPAKKKPLVEIDDDEDEENIQVGPPRKKAAAAAKPMRRRDERYEDDEEEDVPRRKSGKGTPSGMVLALGGIGLVLVLGVVAIGAWWALRDDSDKGQAASNEPPVNPIPPRGGGSSPMAGHGGQNTQPTTGPTAPATGPSTPGTGSQQKPNTGGTTTVAATPKVSRNAIYEYVLKSAVFIFTKHAQGGAMGTGSLIDRDNRLVLTNYHVVHGMVDFFVLFPTYEQKDGKRELIRVRSKNLDMSTQVKGTVVAHDKTHDLALIQLDRIPEGLGIEALPFAKTDPASGDDVHSVGNPGASDSLWVYTPGHVRSVYRKQFTAGGGDLILNLDSKVVETDSPTNPGDSGGPCVNDRGELVGVTQSTQMGAMVHAMSLFIDRSEAEAFIDKAFKATSQLSGKTWVRAQRPSLSDVGGGQVAQLPSLVGKLSSPDDNVRAEGALGLGLLGADARLALPELLKAWNDKNGLVKRLVGEAVRKIGQPTRDDLPDLLPVLETGTPEARMYVLEALAVLGGDEKAAPAAANVLKATSDPDAHVRIQAMRATGKMVKAIGEKDARFALEKGMQDSDPKVCAAAAEALVLDVPSVKNDVPKLVELLKNKKPEIAMPAAKALGLLGDKGKAANPDLLAMLLTKDPGLQRACLMALKSTKPEPKELVTQLRVVIKSEDAEVQRLAIEAAGTCNEAAKELAKPIADALSNPDVRLAALTALKNIGKVAANDGADPVARLVVNDKALRKEALETLEELRVSGRAAELVAPKLIELFADEQQAPIRDKMVTVLSKMGKQVVAPLTQGLTNTNPSVRKGVAKALGAMAGEAKTVAVIQSLKRAAAVETDEEARGAEIDAEKKISLAPSPGKPY